MILKKDLFGVLSDNSLGEGEALLQDHDRVVCQCRDEVPREGDVILNVPEREVVLFHCDLASFNGLGFRTTVYEVGREQITYGYASFRHGCLGLSSGEDLLDGLDS